MLKNALAMIAIGSLVAGSSFAAPLHIEKMMMKDHMMKSSLVSNKHVQKSQSRFSGTWAGTCQFAGENMEAKVRIYEDEVGLIMKDLIHEGLNASYLYNVIESESKSNKDWYDSYTSRLTRVNENTLKHETSGVFGNQLPSSTKEKEFASVNYTSMYTVNNNQLIIDTNGVLSGKDGNKHVESKCVLKRAG